MTKVELIKAPEIMNKDYTPLPMSTQTPPTIYLRRCDITGEGMNSGWLFGDGELYIKHEQDVVDYLRKHGGDYELSALDRPADDLLQAAFELDICYWTEWEDAPEDGDTYYDADGNEYTHKA